jgi:hypothetical protein
VLERAIALVGSRLFGAGRVGSSLVVESVLRPSKPRRTLQSNKYKVSSMSMGQSLDVTAFPAMVEVLAQGKTLRCSKPICLFLFV